MPEKYEREIEEIIGNTDLGPRRPLKNHFEDARRRMRLQFTAEMPQLFRWVTPTLLGGLGAVLLITSLVVRSPYLVMIAIALMSVAYLISIARGKPSHRQLTGFDKSWRGQPVDYSTRVTWRDRFRRWFGKE